MLSNDKNLLDLCVFLSRNSKLRNSSMACILFEPRRNVIVEALSICEKEISVATNRPMFGEDTSDVHAEVAAISKISSEGWARLSMRLPGSQCLANDVLVPW
jgi:hypothetical protein